MAVTAQIASKCWQCHGGIAPGDKILKQKGKWVHESCYVPKEQLPGHALLPGLAAYRAQELARRTRETQ